MSKPITFICCPKPFTSEFHEIQNNAIVSWTKLKSVNQIIICGNETGVKEYADQLLRNVNRRNIEIIHIPNVPCNEYGTPLVDEIFKIGSSYCEKYICYINSDIILLSDFDTTFQAYIASSNNDDCLIVGQRWDWFNPTSVNFNDANWEEGTKQKALSDGEMHAPSGIDYFLHTKTTYPFIYPFGIGKFWWDNWLMGNAYKRENVKTVDVTNTVFAIHQNSPWFQGNKALTQDKKQDFLKSAEVIKNHSFDNYGKVITNGTRYKSIYSSDNTISFLKK
jgi:hypothetical protein